MTFWVGMNMGFLQNHRFYLQTYIFDQFKFKTAIFNIQLARERAWGQGFSIFANFIPCFSIGPNSSKTVIKRALWNWTCRNLLCQLIKWVCGICLKVTPVYNIPLLMPQPLSLLFKRRWFGKTSVFLNFCRKMRKLSPNIANKCYIRSPRGMNTKRTAFLAYLA